MVSKDCLTTVLIYSTNRTMKGAITMAKEQTRKVDTGILQRG